MAVSTVYVSQGMPSTGIRTRDIEQKHSPCTESGKRLKKNSAEMRNQDRQELEFPRDWLSSSMCEIRWALVEIGPTLQLQVCAGSIGLTEAIW